jgi:D-alanine transaminase
MSRISYVNGRYLPHNHASVHIEDRGYQFADGLYEVWGVRHGRLQDHDLHMERLRRSLEELQIPKQHSTASLDIILKEVIRRNRVRDGMVYLQITRGVAPRDHAWGPDMVPSIVVTAKSIDYVQANEKAGIGIAVRSMPDLRWKRCDIKSVSLLPNVLAKHQARQEGSYEAWLVDDDGFVTEGSSTNAWIVTQDGVMVSRKPGPETLSGVTRLTLIDIAREHQLKIEERPFTIEEAKQASEAFLSAATTLVMPVIFIDGSPIGDGSPGPLARRLRQIYLDRDIQN